MVSRHTKVFGSIAGFIFLASMIVLFVFIYVIISSNSQLTEQKVKREQALLHQQDLDALARLVEETGAERGELMGYVIDDEEVITFLALIETLGREQGVELKTDALTVAEKNDLIEVLQVQISMVGPYDSVLHLLSIFESLPYRSFIANVSFAQAAREITWNATFTLHVSKFKKL